MATLNHSKTLFVSETLGDIHFYMVPCEERKSLRPLIEHGGGRISNHLQEQSIRLLPTGTEAKSDGMIKSSYVLDCVKANRLLKLDTYRLNKGDSVVEDDIDEAHPYMMRVEAQGRRGRARFFLEEKRAIIEYLLTEMKYAEAKGNAVWKTMEEKEVTKHTWQSMKDHYHKIILPRIHTFGLSKTDIARLTGDWTGVREDVRREKAREARKPPAESLSKPPSETPSETPSESTSKPPSTSASSSDSDVPGEGSVKTTRTESRQGLVKLNVESVREKSKRSMDKDADTASDRSNGSTGKGKRKETIAESSKGSSVIVKVEGAENMTDTSERSKEKVAEISKKRKEKVTEKSKQSKETVAEKSKQSKEKVAESSKKNKEKVAEKSKQSKETVSESSKQRKETVSDTPKQRKETVAESSKQRKETVAESSKQRKEKIAESSKQSKEKVVETSKKNKEVETSKQSKETVAETSKQTRQQAVVRPTMRTEKNTGIDPGVLLEMVLDYEKRKAEYEEALSRDEETRKHAESPSNQPSTKKERGKLNRSAEVLPENVDVVIDTSSVSLSTVIRPILKTPKTSNQARLSVTHISDSDSEEESELDDFDLELLGRGKGDSETTSAIATATTKSPRRQVKGGNKESDVDDFDLELLRQTKGDSKTTAAIATSTRKSPRGKAKGTSEAETTTTTVPSTKSQRQSPRVRDGKGGVKRRTGNDEAPEQQETPRKRAKRNLELTTLSEPQSKPAENTSLNSSQESSKRASKAKRNLERTTNKPQSNSSENTSPNSSQESSKSASKGKRNLEETTLSEPQSKSAENMSSNNSQESSKSASKAKRDLEETTPLSTQMKTALNIALNMSANNSKPANSKAASKRKGKGIPGKPNLTKNPTTSTEATEASGDSQQSKGKKMQNKATLGVRNLVMSQETEETSSSENEEDESKKEAPGVDFEKACGLVTRTCRWLEIEPAELLHAVYQANGSLKQAVHSIIHGAPEEDRVIWTAEDDALLQTGTDTDVEELEVRYGTHELIKRQHFLADFSKDADSPDTD